MTTLTHDIDLSRARVRAGLGLALASATAFGLSGSLARGLLDAGWSTGAAVTVRVWLAALVLVVPALLSLRGRWGLLRDNTGLVVAYGVVAVAGCQLCYFNAVAHMEVGVALLIEYTAPAAVVAWLWLRHDQRPTAKTVAGALICALGLVLVLGLAAGGVEVSTVGVLWALGAMGGAACYFVLSARDDTGLPPLVLAAGGLLIGGVALLLAGLVRIVPMDVSAAAAAYRGVEVPWWLPVLGLGLVTAALAYTTGIAAGRRLGSRLASFVALSEVVMAIGFAWLLLVELPSLVQLLGGLLILVGVVVVKLGERPLPGVLAGDQDLAHDQ